MFEDGVEGHQKCLIQRHDLTEAGLEYLHVLSIFSWAFENNFHNKSAIQQVAPDLDIRKRSHSHSSLFPNSTLVQSAG